MARNKYDVDETLESSFNIENLKSCGKYIGQYKLKMIIALIVSTAGSIIGLTGPLIIQEVLGVAIPDANVKYLLQLTALLAGTIIINIIFGIIRTIIIAQVGQNIIHDIRRDLFVHLQKLPFSYYDDRPHGKIFVRVVNYVNSVSDAMTNGIINLVIEVVNIVFIIIFMYRVSPPLATVTLVGLPIVIAFVLFIKPKQHEAWRSVANSNSNATAFAQESIEGARISQAFDRQAENQSILERLLVKRKAAWLKAVYISNSVWVTTETVSQLAFTLIYITGVYWIDPMVDFAVLLTMGAYSARFWQPIMNLANLYNSFVNAISYLERIFETINEKVEVADADDAYILPPIKGEVEFKDVKFAYDKETYVLKGVNFKANAGDSIAFVGPTGAGKTTVVNLISRFYNIDEGNVLIDGNDIMKVTLNSLRSQMGIMLQDSFIFSGTIMDNIRYGRLDATDDEIVAAAKAIHAHEFISQLKDGYNTEVTERGGGLSQGQKQLLSFARTLLADPKILVLDEATSSVDTSTEKLIQEGIDLLLKGRTSFIIAHRLSTIKHCTKIMYVDGGILLESGTHDELIEKKGKYYDLYMAQYNESMKDL